MKTLLFLTALALGLLVYRHEQRWATADANLQRAQQQIAALNQQMANPPAARSQSSAPAHSYYHQPSGEAASQNSAPPRPGQWMWEKRTTPLDMASDPGDRGTAGRGHRGSR